ncbi:hypothetical protein [Candidatus Thiosymbion oneisti]|uniref:hypothetical protein n=1 Tax=Candidatus Thiosymbion oneisti TaxID=589554 RepID=UPI000A43C69E|nr:hypothetical protein [Candidatus Thiosymbion oneisti]
MPLENTIIVVDKEPYCIWEVDISEQNEKFLKSIDVEYFDYVLKQNAEAEDDKRASVALQLAYHHALETLFSYIGAYIQAPDCAYAWIAKVQNVQLRSVIEKVSLNDDSLFTKLNIPSISWKNISRLVFQQYMPGTEKQNDTIELFADLWFRLAREFTDDNHAIEYNSMKHGFRVHPGGFGLSVGIEHEYGVPCPKDEMKTVGYSEYGVSLYTLEKVGNQKGSRSLISKNRSFNWRVEKTIILLQLISNSINNIVGALRIANGVSANTIKFLRPVESEFFTKAWGYTPGINNLCFHYTIEEKYVAYRAPCKIACVVS